jgi:Spx/MgsR family transcriptional regulator
MVYGIKNCNTVKKALDWLQENNIAYNFHDYKKEPATLEKLVEWEKSLSWTDLLNKKGTTWKKLSLEVQQAVLDVDTANEQLLKNNSMIKRPLIETDKGLLLGFNELEYATKLK